MLILDCGLLGFLCLFCFLAFYPFYHLVMGSTIVICYLGVVVASPPRPQPNSRNSYKSTTDWKVGGSIPACSSLYPKVSLG